MNATELKVTLDQHKLWIEGGRKKGKRANFGGADLEGANLRGVNLQGADLQGANLQNAYLAGTNLRGTNLQDANLQGVYLQGAVLEGATFDLNFKKVTYFELATFSENQIAWVCLHPRYHEWADSLKWMKAERLSA